MVGLVYFNWRWSYFGEFLPLPLIVKSTGDTLWNGLKPNVNWARDNSWIIATFSLSMLYVFSNPNRIILALVPLIALLVFLTFGDLTQNLEHRFQAPITASMFFVSSIGLAVIFKRSNANSIRISSLFIFFLLASINGAITLRNHIKYLTNGDYINFFPIHLCPYVNAESSIALTEAGRLAYWMPGRFFDLVGLNTAHTAKNGATPNYISSLAPDMIFIHVAGTAEFLCPENYCVVEPDEFIEATSEAIEKSESKNRVFQAPFAVYKHVAKELDRYELLVVHYGQRHDHLYAISREGNIDLSDVIFALDRSFSAKSRLSYIDALKSSTCHR